MGNSPSDEIRSNNPKPKEEVFIGLMNVNNTKISKSGNRSLLNLKSTSKEY